jgi:hypothetical protein
MADNATATTVLEITQTIITTTLALIGAQNGTDTELEQSQYTVFLQNWICKFITAICMILSMGKLTDLKHFFEII